MRYLIHCGTGIGDVAFILPMARAIKENDKDAYITVFNNTGKERFFKTKGLFEIQDYIDNIDYYNKKEIIHSIKFLLKNILNRYDYGFDIEYDYIDNKRISFWPYLIQRFSSKKVCGFEDKNNIKCIKYDITVKRKSHENIVSTILRMVSALGYKDLYSNEKIFNESKIEKILTENTTISFLKKEKYVVLAIGAGMVSTIDKGLRYAEEGNIKPRNLKNHGKQWPYKKWAELSNKLQKLGYKVVILGGIEENKEISNFHLPDSVLNFAGHLTLPESIAIINNALLCVGGDTGLMHCAGICQKKSIILLGCTGVEHKFLGSNIETIQLGLNCQPCIGTERIATCKSPECIENIPVNLVLDKILRMINEH